MTPNRERVLVGLFVVIAAAVLSVTTVAVWGGMRRSGVSHRLYLKFSGGVQPGTPVRYGGVGGGAVQIIVGGSSGSTRKEVQCIVHFRAPHKTCQVCPPANVPCLY